MAMKENKDEDSDHEVNDQNLYYEELFSPFKEIHDDM